MKNEVLIIAEAGVNHNGDLELARDLVFAAAESGADYVKFQTFRATSMITKHAPLAAYQNEFAATGKSQLDMLTALEMNDQMHRDLISCCKKCGIGFLSTGFGLESIQYLKKIGQRLFKIPSGEITNLPYLREIGSYGYPIILSTGMATIGEIEAALEVLTDAGAIMSEITVLHCNTEYPTPICDVNLRAMHAIREAFKVKVGYSDHTSDIEIAVAAVALGASVIEKHLTLDRSMPGPDHRASIEPQQFGAMVRFIRNIELALGDGVKRPSQSEKANIEIVRKSLVAKCEIRAGEKFTPDNVAVKRPGTGLSPMNWDKIMGRAAARNFAPDDFISF